MIKRIAGQIAVVILLSSLKLWAQTGHDEARHGVGIGANVSTLGIGAEGGVGLGRKFNLRGGFHIFNYDRSFTRDGIHYNGTFNLRSGQVLLDWFPTGSFFHLSPGVLIYNGNQLDANANVPGGQTFNLGGTTFQSNPANPVSGSGKLEFNKAAPVVLFGFGNLVPRRSHFSATVDLGVAFHGTPTASLSLAGSACAPNGTNCRNAATDPTVESSLQSEVAKLNRNAEPYKVYPIISVGFGYRF